MVDVRPTVVDLHALAGLVGSHLGYSAWRQIDQGRIDKFADATDDHQWIHVDPARAASGPFGGTVAHGYLTLSLGPALLAEVLEVTGVEAVVNYGLNRVRFPAPVRAGANVRMGAELAAVDDVAGGVQITLALTFEVEGQPKPCCVAEAVFRFFRPAA